MSALRVRGWVLCDSSEGSPACDRSFVGVALYIIAGKTDRSRPWRAHVLWLLRACRRSGCAARREGKAGIHVLSLSLSISTCGPSTSLPSSPQRRKGTEGHALSQPTSSFCGVGRVQGLQPEAGPWLRQVPGGPPRTSHCHTASRPSASCEPEGRRLMERHRSVCLREGEAQHKPYRGVSQWPPCRWQLGQVAIRIPSSSAPLEPAMGAVCQRLGWSLPEVRWAEGPVAPLRG